MNCTGSTAVADRRVLRTKKLLRNSLFSLIGEKPADKITVKDLTLRAGVNRSTFYCYFSDIPDMLEKLQDEVYGSFASRVLINKPELSDAEKLTAYIRAFLDFILENADVCTYMADSDVFSTLSQKIRNALFGSLPDSKSVFPESDPRRYSAVFGMYGAWAAIIEWMHEGMKIPADVFSSFLVKFYLYGGRAVRLGE